ncbi:MAG: UDP-3-O-(3-hydroxymyristoyl)glucosamine N-acyltransferase [Phycisphaerales bacterium]|nr:UDP-3-O-(3-hydroxymyristoyl)glucosamine N-acyltransferase [Phycisphaerales bacterium]
MGHTTGSIAKLLGAVPEGPDDLPITGVEALSHAAPGHLTFLRSAEFAAQWSGSGASAALVAAALEVPGHDATRRTLLRVPDADLAMIRALELFAPPPAAAEPGVHPTAVVDPAARLGRGVSIGPHCLVGAGTTLGDGVVLEHAVTLGRGVGIGPGTLLRAGVTILDRCTVGARCILHPGVIVGTDGFGYRPAPDGRGVVKIPHIGYVRIEDDVEIGANSCIDRGKFGPTVIGAGTKIDNLVQIAHNCVVGRACLIAGQAALAGSVTLGDGVILGGQVGVADNLRIGPGAVLAAQSGVTGHLAGGLTYLGTPARPIRETRRIYAGVRRIEAMLERLRALEKAARDGAKA